MRVHHLSGLPLLVAVCVSLSSQAPVFIADINRQPDTTVRSSNPSFMGVAGGRLFFMATTPTTGAELWSTLGTRGSTLLTADIYPAGDAYPSSFIEHGGFAYFGADDGEHGVELWRSDGSTAGTQLVHDVSPGPGASNAAPVAAAGRWVFFMAGYNPQRALWVTDGSTAGLRQTAAPLWSEHFATVGARVYFLVPSNGVQLWQSDGVSEGLVTTLPGTRATLGLLAAGQRLFLAVERAGVGVELWTSDGTAAGTVRVPHPGPFWPGRMVALGNQVLFIVGPTASANLWQSDGTASGTFALGAVTVDGFVPMRAAGSRVFFAGREPATGRELWCTDGSVAGTRLVADLNPGAGDTPFGVGGACGSELRFVIESTPPELWRSDGTASGTRKIVDLASSVWQVTCVPGTAISIFDQGTAGVGREPWRTDGTAAGTFLLADLAPAAVSAGCGPGAIADLAGTVLLAANDGIHGQELWRTDGTASGTRMVADLVPGLGGSQPGPFVVSGDRAFFLAGPQPPAQQALFQLCSTDGTTVRVAPLPAPVMPGSPPLALLSPGVVVCVTSTASVAQVWRSDFSAAGTRPLLQLAGVPYGRVAVIASGLGRALVLIGYGMTGTLVATDGTAAGTRILTTFSGGSVDGVGWFGDLAYFRTAAGLWQSDGTAAGTRLIGAAAGDYEIVGDRLFFSAGDELFVVQGGNVTPLGTQLGYVVFVGQLADSALFWPRPSAALHQELWRSDGTVAGTRRVFSQGGNASGAIGRGARHGSARALFTAGPFLNNTPAVLWETDGTERGTRALMPWLGRRIALMSNGRLFLTMDDGVHGNEPWTLQLGAVAQALGQGCGEGRPMLTSDDPRLGTTVRIDTSGAAAVPSLAVLLLSGGSSAAVPLVPDAGCYSYLDPQAPLVGLALAPQALAWRQFIAIGNANSFVGVTLRLQAVFGPTRAPLGMDLTPALTWRLGR